MLQFSRRNPRTTLAFFSVLFLALFLACGTSSNVNGGSIASTSVAGKATQPSKTAQHFKVGDKVAINNLFEVTINSFVTNPGSDFSQPAAGNQFVVIDVTIKNISAQEQNLSSLLQFTLKDSTGQKYTETILGSGTTPDGKLAAGDIVKGQVTYEVPTSQKQFSLAFEADIISSGQTIWDLSL